MNEVNLRLIWHTVQRTYENKTVGTSPPSCPPDPLLRLCQRSTSVIALPSAQSYIVPTWSGAY